MRRVLHAFAYGGGTTDAQITTWANLTPGEAIVQMLGMWTVHDKLAKAYEGGSAPVSPENGSLSNLSNWFSAGNYAKNPSDYSQSVRWGNGIGRSWINAVKLRGLNPFRQRICLWETNYHLATNLDKNVDPVQMVYYYDTICNNLASGKAYYEVLADAALSAAVATQYNHRKNVFIDGSFRGNEDFAREFHQLFFSILGTGVNGTCKFGDVACAGNPESFDDHELKTIRQTAEALTDIRVEGGGGFLPYTPIFGTSEHYTGKVSIYGVEYGGSTAKERINSIAPQSIRHPESLQFLPLSIIRELADDNLDSANPVDGCDGTCASLIPAKVTTIRQLWASSTSTSGEMNLIEFLRKYAVSSAFHNASRIKFLHSIDRTMLLSNVTGINNLEVGVDNVATSYKLYLEGVVPFRPEHDVFGGQTGLEASDTDGVFVSQFNSTQNYSFGAVGYWNGSSITVVKNFRTLLEAELTKTGDGYNVKDVSEFLWRRITADQNLSFFSDSARAQVYALLASGNDLLFYNNTECRTSIWSCTATAINTASPTLTDLNSTGDTIRNLRDSAIFRDSSDADTIKNDNARVGSAINFIAATPFVFVQTGN